MDRDDNTARNSILEALIKRSLISGKWKHKVDVVYGRLSNDVDASAGVRVQLKDVGQRVLGASEKRFTRTYADRRLDRSPNGRVREPPRLRDVQRARRKRLSFHADSVAGHRVRHSGHLSAGRAQNVGDRHGGRIGIGSPRTCHFRTYTVG